MQTQLRTHFTSSGLYLLLPPTHKRFTYLVVFVRRYLEVVASLHSTYGVQICISSHGTTDSSSMQPQPLPQESMLRAHDVDGILTLKRANTIPLNLMIGP